jgi:hypothetical protein
MMSHQEHKPGEEKMILAHDAVKGYRPVFYICITLGILYLALILVETL